MDQNILASSEISRTPKSSRAVPIECIWRGPATLGECPIWDDRRGRLFWIDSIGKKIWQSTEVGSCLQSWKLPDLIGSIGLCEDGRLIAGLSSGFAFIELADEEAIITPIGNPDPLQEDTRLNDGKTDRQGRFWCGTMNIDFADTNASLFRLDKDLTWTRMASGITVSNGIAFSLDGKILYFSDSRVDQSYQFDLDTETGNLSGKRPFIDTSTYRGRIDGATIDAVGNYWGALFEGGAIGCFSSRGELLRRIELPVSCPTMCAFGGKDMATLFVTSATFLMSEKQIADKSLSGSLLAIHGLGVQGIPEPRFAG